jgi:hypothetical protein
MRQKGSPGAASAGGDERNLILHSALPSWYERMQRYPRARVRGTRIRGLTHGRFAHPRPGGSSFRRGVPETMLRYSILPLVYERTTALVHEAWVRLRLQARA